MDIKDGKRHTPEKTLENTTWLCGFCALVATTYFILNRVAPREENAMPDIFHVPNFYRLFKEAIPAVANKVTGVASYFYNS